MAASTRLAAAGTGRAEPGRSRHLRSRSLRQDKPGANVWRLGSSRSKGVERVLQLLDDLDDLLAYASFSCTALAWRLAGLAGGLAAAFAVSLPL